MSEIKEIQNFDFPGKAKNVLVLPEDGQVVSVVDPATIAILIKIGEAIIANLAVKALLKIFDLNKDGELADFIKSLLEEVIDAVGASIDQAFVKEASEQLSSIANLLQEYNDAPDTEGGRSRLLFVINESLKPLETLKNHLPLAVLPFATGALTRLAALQEEAIREKVPAKEKRLNDYAASYEQLINGSIDQLLSARLARIGSIRYSQRNLGDWEGPDWRFYASYSRDGQIQYFESRDKGDVTRQVEASRNAALSRANSQFQQQIGLPISSIVNQFAKLKTWKLPAQ